MKKRRAIICLLSYATHADDGKIQDSTVLVDPQGQAISVAIEKARASLDDFLVLNNNPPPESENFKLKVMVEDENGVEHLWFTPFEQRGDQFVGFLANEPQVVTSVTFGEVYGFERSQVTDWGYERNGVQYGSFTVCALFLFMDKAIVDAYKNDHGFICDD